MPSTFRCTDSRRNLKPVLHWIVGIALFSELACALSGTALAAQAAVTKACHAPALPVTGSVIQVSTETQLQAAMKNLQPGMTILVANGTYNLSNTLHIDNVSNVTI